MRLMTALSLAFLLSVAALCAAQSGNGNGKGKSQGKKSGVYSLKVVGQYFGQGSGTIWYPNQGKSQGRGRGRGGGGASANAISITATLKTPSGATGTVTFPNMPLVNDRFRGTASLGGATLNISGRIDMPANTDADQTPAQKITGRISALLMDSSGKGGRLIAIENESSRALIPID
jgi:hypothetical protein